MQNAILTVAVVQDSPCFLDKKKTIEKACQLISKGAKSGASLIVFPEAFVSGYPDWVWTVPPSNKKTISSLFSDLYESAVSIPNDDIADICTAAKENNIYVIIGINEINSEASNASIYNSMCYINNSGVIDGIHRKLIPTGGERLMWAQGDGTTLHSFQTDFGKIGGLICWENYMPLARQTMYENGVQIYAAPTWDSSESWQTGMRHIAREGGMFVLSATQAVKKEDIPDKYEFKTLYADDREWINQGNSCIINPSGKIIAGPLNSEKGILTAEIDLQEIKDQKWLFDVAGHYARPDVFDFNIKY